MKSTNISNENKKILMDFYKNCIVRGLRRPTILHYLQVLSKISKTLNKDFGQATFQDIERVLVGIKGAGYNERTKNNYKIILRKFYRWLGKPRLVKQIRIKKVSICSISPKNLYTEEDVERLVKATRNARDKALISTLYESGARIVEFLTLKIKDVEFIKHVAFLTIRRMSDNSVRYVPIKKSVPYLKKWIKIHPLNDDPDAFLWVTKDNKPLNSPVARKVLRSLALKAGIKKKVYPHLLRRSRAVELCRKGLNLNVIQKFFGWKLTRIPHVHILPKNLDDTLKIYGLSGGKKPKLCSRCGCKNLVTSKFCSQCGASFQ